MHDRNGDLRVSVQRVHKSSSDLSKSHDSKLFNVSALVKLVIHVSESSCSTVLKAAWQCSGYVAALSAERFGFKSPPGRNN